MLGTLLIYFLVHRAIASPSANFAINAQYPPVAAISAPYVFQFAPETFISSESADLQYTLQDAPRWLQIDPGSRQLSGTPGPNDIGSPAFSMQATDTGGSASMQITLIVVDSINIQPPNDIMTQLEKFGTLSNANSLSFYTSQHFNIAFGSDTFQGPSGLICSATSSDRSPLPSWVIFDAQSMTFSGLTPPLTAIPQTFGITLIASTIVGFAEATTSFDLIINDHQLAFDTYEYNLPFVNGSADLTSLFTTDLLLDGQPISAGFLQSTDAEVQSGLSYDPGRYMVTGEAPAGITSQDITISANDMYGDVAEAVVHMHFSTTTSLFIGNIGPLIATIGRSFSHQIPSSALSKKVTSVTFALGAASSWLKFDAASLRLSGRVPLSVRPSTISATISAISPDTTESQDFAITLERVMQTASTTFATSKRVGSTHTSSSGGTPGPSTVPRFRSGNSSDGGSQGRSAGIALGVIALFALSLLLLCCCWRRRKQKKHLQGPKPKLMIQKLPDQGLDGNGNVQSLSDGLDMAQPRMPAPAPRLARPTAGMGDSIRSSTYQSDNSTLRQSEETTLESMNATTDGTHGLTILHPSYGPFKALGTVSELSSTRAQRHRFSLLSRRSQGMSGDRAIVGLGLGHGRPSYQTSGGNLLASLSSGSKANRLSQLSSGRESRRSQHTFAFAREQRRSRQGGTSKHSIRVVEPEREVDFTKKYDHYIRKRASSKRMSNPLFAGYSAARFSSRQSSMLLNTSILQLKGIGSTHRESQSSSIGAGPVHPRGVRQLTDRSLGQSDRSTEGEYETETDVVSSVYEDEVDDGDDDWEDEELYTKDNDPIVLARSRKDRTSPVDREFGFRGLSCVETPPSHACPLELKTNQSSARSGKAFL